MQSHKAKPMRNTTYFFYQSKDMYGIDFTEDKAPFRTVRHQYFVKHFKILTPLHSKYGR